MGYITPEPLGKTKDCKVRMQKVQHDVQCTLRNALHGCDEVVFCNQQMGKSFASVSLLIWCECTFYELTLWTVLLDWLRITGKFPGYLSPSAGLKFADVPNGLAAISKVPAAGWGQILAYMAFCEVSQDQSAGTPAAAGDFGFKVLTSSDPAEKTKKLNAELANGRLAMMAIIGMFFQARLQHDLCSCGFKIQNNIMITFVWWDEEVCLTLWCRTAWLAVHGETGPTTLPLLCVPSRTSWASRQEHFEILATPLDSSCIGFVFYQEDMR